MSVSLLSDFAAAMERIRAVTGCGTQRELGRFLGINQSACLLYTSDAADE